MTSRIAIIGSRGIPAKYGGFETFAEEISKRLVAKGNVVYVSCEGGVSQKIKEYNGVNLFYFPLKPFYRIAYETIYDVYALIKASMLCDQIYMLGYGAGFFFFIPKLFGKNIIVNVDGIEWRREKYNRWEKKVLYLSELFAVAYSDVIIADSMRIKQYIKNAHNKDAVFIPYGAEEPEQVSWDQTKLKGLITGNGQFYELQPDEYYLAVARLEPENNIHLLVEGFLKSNTSKKLVIVGNFLSDHYRQSLHSILEKYDGKSRVIFTGSIYNKRLLNMLRQNSYAYFHGHSAGGTNPSLLEAMVMGNIIVAHDNEFNREVGDKSLLYFKDAEELSMRIDQLDSNIQQFIKLKNETKNRIKAKYTWDIVADDYNTLFFTLSNSIMDKRPVIAYSEVKE